MRRYHANYPWYQFGIDLALGSGIDQPVGGYRNRRGLAFAPILLAGMLEHSTFKADGLSKSDLFKFGISNPDGYDISIVTKTTIIDADGQQVPEDQIRGSLLDNDPRSDTPKECLAVLPPLHGI